jgi:hypothetical protein
MAFSRANTTNQTDYRNSSRSILQAGEGESGERGRVPRGLLEDLNEIAPGCG